MHSIIQSGLIPGGKDVKQGIQTVFFTAVNPSQAAGLRREEAQDCSSQTKLENTSEYCVLGNFESCYEEGIAVLPNKIERNHPSQYSPSSVY